MKDRLSRWGVGPRIGVAALAYAVLARTAAHRRPDLCRVRFAPYVVIASTAVILLVAGVTMLAFAVRSATKAYDRDQLVTSGIFALVRHPIYSAWIVFIVPGVAVLSRSWPVLLTPVVAYAVFKLSIHREDEYLQQRFGQTYRDYRGRVNEIIPLAPALGRWMNK